jgi:glycosyltransferase involved in cell wall biosynthesis
LNPQEYDLDIILPVYNPVAGWTKTIEQASTNLRAMAPELHFRLILVNDGSTVHFDGQAVRYLRDRLPHLRIISYEPNMGKGYAVRRGAEAATAPIVLFTDVDFPYREEDLLAVFEMLKCEKADLVIATRQEDYYAEAPWSRKWISKILKGLIRYLMRIPTTDTQCGLKDFNPKKLDLLRSTRINRYLFDLELVKRAHQRRDVVLKPHPSRLKPCVVFTPIGFRILRREFRNFIWLLFQPP